MSNSFFSFIYFKFEKFSNIIEMNKWLLATLLSLFVINSTFKSSNAVTTSGKSTLKSGTDGIKRYVLRTKHYNHWLYIDFILYIFSFFYSITMHRVKRNCTTSDGQNRCRNKITRRKRSAVAQPPTDTLLDEEWGVKIAIFRIFFMQVF